MSAREKQMKIPLGLQHLNHWEGGSPKDLPDTSTSICKTKYENLFFWFEPLDLNPLENKNWAMKLGKEELKTILSLQLRYKYKELPHQQCDNLPY